MPSGGLIGDHAAHRFVIVEPEPTNWTAIRSIAGLWLVAMAGLAALALNVPNPAIPIAFAAGLSFGAYSLARGQFVRDPALEIDAAGLEVIHDGALSRPLSIPVAEIHRVEVHGAATDAEPPPDERWPVPVLVGRDPNIAIFFRSPQQLPVRKTPSRFRVEDPLLFRRAVTPNQEVRGLAITLEDPDGASQEIAARLGAELVRTAAADRAQADAQVTHDQDPEPAAAEPGRRLQPRDGKPPRLPNDPAAVRAALTAFAGFAYIVVGALLNHDAQIEFFSDSFVLVGLVVVGLLSYGAFKQSASNRRFRAEVGEWSDQLFHEDLNRLRERGNSAELIAFIDSDYVRNIPARRRHVVVALGNQDGMLAPPRPDHQACEAAAGILATDSSPAVRSEAATLLAFAQDCPQQARDALTAALSDDDERVRRAAIHASGAQGVREAVPSLVEMLEKPALVSRASRALVEIRDARAIDVLEVAAAGSRSPQAAAHLRRAADDLRRAVGG